MIFDRMFVQNDILGAAAQAASVRNEVITSNIANADTPDYKAKAVAFEESLSRAVSRYKKTRTLDLSDVTPAVHEVMKHYNYRIDKNNVDMELEMVNLYQNSVRFDALLNCAQTNSSRLSLAIGGR